MLPNVLQPREADHVPVLAEEVRACLAVEPGETVIDATFGAGGHAAILAAGLRGKGKLIAIDRDPTARTYFEQLTKRATVNARLLRGDFGVVLPQLAGNGVRADAILLDLGVSSMQLDRPERGFSYAADAPLDMRMDPTHDISAADVRGRASGEAGLSGAADRGQRRARLARRCAARGTRDAAAGRPPCRHLLPLPGGPDREAVPPRARARVHVPARLPRLRLRP